METTHRFVKRPDPASFARRAALFSFIAPFAAIANGIFFQPAVRDNRIAMLLLGLTSVLLIFSGLAMGLYGLASIRKHGRQGILGRAVLGTCICGFLAYVIVTNFRTDMQAAARVAQQREQQLKQNEQ
jgi:hypothetical protein